MSEGMLDRLTRQAYERAAVLLGRRDFTLMAQADGFHIRIGDRWTKLHVTPYDATEEAISWPPDVMKEQYCYSLDEENYEGECKTREQALAEAEEAAQDKADSDDAPVFFVWTALAVPMAVRAFAENQAEWFLDRMRDDANDNVGEWAESWLSHVKTEDQDKLGEMLADTFMRWMHETSNQPKCFAVDKTQEHQVEIQPIKEEP